MEILLGVLLFFGLVAYVLSKTEVDVHLDSDNKPITTQDGLEDVVKEEIIETTVITTDDFVDKKTEIDEPSATEEFQNTVGGRQLTEHIAKVIELNPDSKKHLNRRQRKTVDKIVKEKKFWNPGYYDYKKDIFIEYEKRWYCNTNKLIHTSEKEFLNCNNCNKE